MYCKQIENDAYQEDLGYSRGTIGKAGTGRIRLPQIDEKTKVRISKTLQKNLQKQQQWGGSTTVKKQVSGTASSVAFTPLQVCFFVFLSIFKFNFSLVTHMYKNIKWLFLYVIIYNCVYAYRVLKSSIRKLQRKK